MTEYTSGPLNYAIKRGRVHVDVLDLLGFLASHPDQEIDKDEFREALIKWYNKVVSRR